MKNSFYILLMSLLFSGCEIVVDLEIPEHEPLLVLNSVLYPDSIFKLRLSHSVGSFDNVNRSTEVKDATINVYQDDNFMAEMSREFEGMSDGYYPYNSNEFIESDSVFSYVLNTIPLEESTYTFKVSHPSFENVQASSILANQVNLQSLELLRSEADEYSKVNKVSLKFRDEVGAHFYRLRILYGFENQINSKDLVAIGFETSNPSILSSSNSESGEADDVTVSLNDAVFSDALFDGELYTISLDFYTWSYYFGETQSDDSYYVQFSSISKDYFDYLRSYQSHSNSGGVGLFSGEPVQVFTNVQNGLGIFGSSNTQTMELVFPE